MNNVPNSNKTMAHNMAAINMPIKPAETNMAGVENQPAQSLPRPELESTPQTPPASNGGTQNNANPAAQQPIPVQPVVQSQNVHTDSATSRDLHLQSIENLSAEDSDLIEKVWVDKTENVIDTTKDDPYTEDEHQHQLSRTYLKKRFNLDVK